MAKVQAPNMYMGMFDILPHPLNLSEPSVNGSMQKIPDVPMFPRNH